MLCGQRNRRIEGTVERDLFEGEHDRVSFSLHIVLLCGLSPQLTCRNPQGKRLRWISISLFKVCSNLEDMEGNQKKKKYLSKQKMSVSKKWCLVVEFQTQMFVGAYRFGFDYLCLLLRLTWIETSLSRKTHSLVSSTNSLPEITGNTAEHFTCRRLETCRVLRKLTSKSLKWSWADA